MLYFLISYEKLSKKPLFFKSFTDFTVKEFDQIYREIGRKYHKYELQRYLIKKIENEKLV